MKRLTVAPARESEAPACLALLPRVVGATAELLIAREGGEFVGAGAVAWANALEPAGFPVLVKVLTHARRRGVGRALIEAAADLADGETDGLWSLEAVPSDSPAAKFMEACGFTPLRREYHCEIENVPLLGNIQPLVDRMRKRGRIPERVEIRFLTDKEAPLEEIAWLAAREFNGDPLASLQNLLRRREAGSDRSLYVCLEGELLAAMLWRREDACAIVDAWIVAPSWRNSWPNLIVLESALSGAISDGCRLARFFCDEHVNDTINLVRRSGGEEMDAKARYRLPF